MSDGRVRSQARSSLARIAANTGWLLGGKGFSALLSFIYLAIVTRSLGLAGFGQFSIALAAAQAVELLVSFQSWQIVVRYGMPHLHAGRAVELARVLRFTVWLDVGGALVSAVVIAGVMALLGSYFAWSDDFIVQATACGVVFVLATHWTPIGVLRLHDRFAQAALADAMTPIARCLGSIAVWLVEPSVIGFLAVWAAAELLTAIAYWTLALRLKGLSWRLDRPLRWRDVARENEQIGKYSVTTNLASSLDVGGKQVAALLVGLMLTPAAVGGFRLAQQIASSLSKVALALARAIFPELMRSRVDSGGAYFEELLARTLRLTAIGGASAFVLVLLVGRPAMGLIAGSEFLWAYPVLLLLGTAAAIEFAAVGFEPALVALGRPALALRLRFVSTTVLLGGIAALTPLLGTIGAGVAALAAAIVSIALLWLALRRQLRRHPPAAALPEAMVPVSVVGQEP